MQRRQPSAEKPAGGLRSFLVRRRAGLGAAAVVAAAALGGWLAATRMRESLRDDPANVLQPSAVVVTGIAPWVRSDLGREALRDASLDGGVPLDDPELPQRLARAFEMHPWVREVVRVTLRHPAAAAVEVRCREPVAVVAVPSGVLAVDAEGVVLPSDDFTAEAAAAYPRVAGIRSSPVGVYGSPWGDPAVVEAAAVAAAVGPESRALGLRDLRPAGGAGGWELLDDAGRVIRFGSAPGRERAGEPAVAAKLARLRALVAAGERAELIDLTTPP